GISIDALNAANLRRRVSRRFFIQSVRHDANITPVHLVTTWRYAGYCRADRVAAFEFSVDSESSIPFAELDCSGFDLKRDPERKHAIWPLVIGPDSFSKKIDLPFLEPLRTHEPFDVELNCRLPAPFKTGVGYYISTLSFDQDSVANCSVNLTFHGRQPEWV